MRFRVTSNPKRNHLDIAKLAGNLQGRDTVGIERIGHTLPVNSEQLLDGI